MDQMNVTQGFISSRILLTLSYTEQFSYPLTKDELYTRLIVPEKISFTTFLKVLKTLVSKKLIDSVQDYFFVSGLPKQKQLKLIETRQKRTTFSIKKWQEVSEFLNFAEKIPFITGVAVTGSLSVNNVVKDDDIDFMIVTSKGRLWITRLLVILYATNKGKRRSFAKEEKNSWCFNLWVEESDLQLPPASRSIYEAYEVVQARWVLSRNGVARRFLRLNKWVKNLLSHTQDDLDVVDLPEFWFEKLPFISQFFSFCNLFAFIFQYLYMKRHMTREKVSKTHAFFHPRDTRAVVFNNWKKVLLRVS